MNQLTRDELGIIHIDMCININNSHPLKPSPSYIALKNKIEKLIDNYCEHSALKDVGKEYKVCRICGDEICE